MSAAKYCTSRRVPGTLCDKTYQYTRAGLVGIQVGVKEHIDCRSPATLRTNLGACAVL